jgi:DNA-binding YbaB/EbfC family protein
MFKNISDLINLIKNAGPFKEQMEGIKERIARLRVSGDAGAGMVQIVVSGDGKILDCNIDEKLFEPDDFKMLEDLIISATNDALEKARQAVNHEMQNMMGLSNMPNFDQFFKGQQD